ncbi:MAG: HEAT repeat domain-containing protein, partial [Deltaproteobacteria bacterium]|nr:HEAT repeat domain-containing protein [Deltaproteobacteria bacterium]
MLLDQLGNGSIDVQTVAKACRTKPPLDYCDDGTRAMIVAPRVVKDHLVYWRSSCVHGRPEQVEVNTRSFEAKVSSIAALIDTKAYARSPATWARKKLPKLSAAARRDLLKRLGCQKREQRLVLLEWAQKDASAGVRRRALERLSGCPLPAVHALLAKKALGDKALGVRQQAIELLGSRGVVGARQVLRRIQRDPQRSLGERLAAKRSLRKLRTVKQSLTANSGP